MGKPFRVNRLTVPVLCLVSLAIVGIPESATADEREAWVTAELVQEFPASFRSVHDALFHKQHFELVGKLLSVLLQEQDKAYEIRRAGEDEFSIRSRRTIQDGSRIRIVRMDPTELAFTGTLILKRGITFSCDVVVAAVYSVTGETVRSVTSVSYNAPAIVKGIDRLYRAVSGRTFVAHKVGEFTERINDVLSALGRLSPSEWKRLSTDTEMLELLHYPVEFTPEERDLVAATLREGE